ncbi:uncharacterized protein LOC108651552 isoform X1 [Drosophila navojoa]|uniref:uncharacterized protein LOC108651552 isoform X1 n=1 Tax=Drosophila navojoa TaxID=7232 RepID=UPI000847B116|nr:uncharacterized protein LOC108651552 isoform X1 [Drosophila navojoa]XP_017956835.1 uncharacterized protein LOC108651552 isoform X1 [Drosophila navojoa]
MARSRIEASRLLLLLLLILQLIAATPAARNPNSNGNNNNIWRRVRLVTSVSASSAQERERERNAYQLLKANSSSIPSTSTSTTSTTSTSTTTSTTPAPRRSAKQLLRREDLNVPEVNISSAARLEMSTEFFVVPTLTPSTTSSSSGSRRNNSSGATTTPATPTRSQGARARAANTPRATTSGGSATPPSIVSTTQLPFAGLRKEVWVVPVLVLASLTMLMMGAFEIFVLFKAWRTSPSRRHLFLGQMLLLGLFACAGLGAVITAQPTLLSCGAIRFGVGVAYALVFAALLVKCVFLISLNGGVYLPAPYQGLLLLFALLIQVAIGAQWLLTQPPEIYTTSVPVMGSGFLSTTVASQTNYSALFYPTSYTTLDGTPEIYTRIAAVSTVLIPLCKTQFSELLFSLIYIVFLIVFIAVLAIKSRGIRDNYREATYIGLAIGGAIPIWLGWMLCGLAVAERHKDACIAFGLVATSATVFLVMFMPKGRQLAAMGKEGLYVEDREEQFSSLSRAGSGYSPSFFHFKPIKYGVMSGCGLPNSATNTGQGLSSKHCSSANNGGADRVALVTAAPPSYTRMYHYFPAHLSAHPFCYYPPAPPPPPPPPAPPTQLATPLTLKQLGNSITSMTQAAQLAKTLRYAPGMFIRPDETNLYTTLEPTLSSNPNVYFQRSGAVHPGILY